MNRLLADMSADTSFWVAMTRLLASQTILIDRPRGSSHPRYSDMIYPFDYGYLANTTSGDGDGIDVWLGSLNIMKEEASVRMLTGILCTFDTLKRDTEIKLLVGCSREDIEIIRNFHEGMHTLYIPNPLVTHDISS